MNVRFIIRFERSGGFTGIGMEKTIDSLSLQKDEAEMVLKMIDSSQFFSLPARENMKLHPDSFKYKITIEAYGKNHMVEFSQASVPSSMNGLISYLTEKIRLKR